MPHLMATQFLVLGAREATVRCSLCSKLRMVFNSRLGFVARRIWHKVSLEQASKELCRVPYVFKLSEIHEEVHLQLLMVVGSISRIPSKVHDDPSRQSILVAPPPPPPTTRSHPATYQGSIARSHLPCRINCRLG